MSPRVSVPRTARLSAFSALPGNMFDLAVSSLFLNILGLALPLSLLQVYDRIIPNSSSGTLTLLVAGTGVAVILENLLRLARSSVTAWIGARFEHMAGCAAMERLLTSDIKHYEREGAGVHLERINALPVVREFYAGQAVLVLLDLPFVILYLAGVGFLGGSLVVVPIVVLAAFAFAAFVLGNQLRNALKDRVIADERRFNFIIEALGGIHTIKSMAMEAQMLRRYERLQETCAKGDYQVTLHSASALGMSAFLAQLCTVAVVAIGALFVTSAQMTTGGLAACTMLAGRALQPLMRAIGVWTRLQTIRLARERMRQIFAIRRKGTGVLERHHAAYCSRSVHRHCGREFKRQVHPARCDGRRPESHHGAGPDRWTRDSHLRPDQLQTAGRVHAPSRRTVSGDHSG